KPLTMSLPTWANGPVIGAMNPIRNSSAAAPTGRLIANARQAPINAGRADLAELLIIVATPLVGRSTSIVGLVGRSPRRGRQALCRFRHACRCEQLADLRRNAHQAAR